MYQALWYQLLADTSLTQTLNYVSSSEHFNKVAINLYSSHHMAYHSLISKVYDDIMRNLTRQGFRGRQAVFCGTRSAESCQGVIWRKFDAEFFLRNEG